MKQSEEQMEQNKEQMDPAMEMKGPGEPGDTAHQEESAAQGMEGGDTTAYKEESDEPQKTSWWQFWK